MSLPKNFVAGERLFASDLNDNFDYVEDEIEERAIVVNTDNEAGKTFYVGSIDPTVSYSPVTGDVWIEVPS